MKQEGSIALFRYWNSLRNGRPAPRRAEVEPGDIRKLLSDTFILERDGRGEAVFRLAGTRLCAIHGRELKGFSFPSLWRARDQRMIARLTQNTFVSQTVVAVDYQGESEKGRKIPFELVLLPLEGGAETQRCLGIAVAVEKPYWLGADPIVSSHVDAVRVIDPDREQVFLRDRPGMSAPPLVPDEASLDLSHPAGKRVRHLLVLDGGRETAGARRAEGA